MAEFSCTPMQEKPVLKYVDRLQEIKRAICTLDESLTPSKRIGNKSIGLSPMFGTPMRSTSHSDSIALLDYRNVLTPSKTSMAELSMEVTQISSAESLPQNPEIAANVDQVTSTNSLIIGFCRAYKEQAMEDVLSVISSYSSQCNELLDYSKNILASVKHSKKLSQQIKRACSDIANERYTWKLLGAIYQNKLSPAPEEMEGENNSPMSTINRLYAENEEIRHCQVVLDWLESNAAEILPDLPTKVGYFSGKVSWENTFHSLCNQKQGKTVSSMDPDAPSREGAPLNEVDLDDQARLIKHLFCLVRAGQSDEAQRLCISAGQCWRAAVIDGWRLYNDPNYSTTSQQREAVEGNANRALWKSCCWEFCSAASISAEERALYGALSGNLKAMLSACCGFHDKLWAHFKTLIDQQVEGELCDSLLPSAYWKNPLSVSDIVDIMGRASQSEGLHNKLQLQLIAGDIAGVLGTITNNIGNASVSERRFLCHLLLVLQILHPDLATDVLYNAIAKYVLSLREEECFKELIYYSSQLPLEPQVQLLAEVLRDVDDDQRDLCVQFAYENSVPIEDVTMKIFQHLISQYTPSNSDVVSVANISNTDAKIVSAVSWLLLTDTQRSTALRQANRLIRRFLGARKHAPACAVFETIPPDSIEVINREWAKEYPGCPLGPDDLNSIREYLCLQAYLDTHQAYNDWCCHSSKRPSPPATVVSTMGTFSEQVAEEEKKKSYEVALQRWEQNLCVQTQLTRDKMLNVLLFIDGGWLVDEVEGTEPERAEQLHALRTQCIPSTTFLLVNVLRESGEDRAVVELSDYIASEQHQLYKLFNQQELRRFLDLVYESSIRCECDPLQFSEPKSEENIV